MKRLIHTLLLALAAPAAAQGPAEPPPLALEQRLLLRCSAAFALVADRQARGEQWALAYPPLAERGREYFVRATARVMDEAQLSDEQLEAALRGEAEQLLADDLLADIMPVCLPLLPAE